MKEGWEIVALGNLCNFENGDRGKNYPGRKAFVPTGIPFINAGHLDDGAIDWDSMDYIPRVRFDLLGNGKVKKNDLLFCLRGSLGKFAVVAEDTKGAIASSLVIVRPSKRLDLHFLEAYFRTNICGRMISKFSNGAAQPNLSAKSLRAFEIPLPPLPEQKRLVAILDEAFAGIDKAIANTEKNLINARELFESYLNEIFTRKGDGWVEMSLDDVCSIASKLVDPRKKNLLDLPHIGAGNMVSKTGEIINVLTAQEEGLISGKFLFDVGTVLYSKIRPYLMKTCRPEFAGLCSADVYPLAVRPKLLDRNFLFHLLLSQHFTEYAISGSLRAGMPKVNRSHLFNFRTFFPDVAKQRRLANQMDILLNESVRLEDIYQRKIDALAELKQSILKKAFAGELTRDQMTETRSVHPVVADCRAEAAKTSPEFTAKILAFAHRRHATKLKEKTYGRVKAQKFLHLVESIGGIELGRIPIKDAAGPNDFSHMLKAEEWARQQKFFEFVKRADGGYDFKKLNRYDALITKALIETKPHHDQLDKVVDLLLPMNSKKAEVFATVHAAWNNLILDATQITNIAIVQEARENWHPNKMEIPKSEFIEAIRLIRSKSVIPDGSAKRVGGQESLL